VLRWRVGVCSKSEMRNDFRGIDGKLNEHSNFCPPNEFALHNNFLCFWPQRCADETKFKFEPRAICNFAEHCAAPSTLWCPTKHHAGVVAGRFSRHVVIAVRLRLTRTWSRLRKSAFRPSFSRTQNICSKISEAGQPTCRQLASHVCSPART